MKPKKKTTSGKRKRRGSHFALKGVQLVKDANGKLVPQRYLAASKKKNTSSSAPKTSKKKATA